jgi:hypothetical protein
MHAVNKAAIIDKELYGFAEPVDALFSKNAPYCDIDLTPRWDYDLEKAQLLNCPAQSSTSSTLSEDDDDNTELILGLTLGVAALLLIAIGVGCFFTGKHTERYKHINESVNVVSVVPLDPSVVGSKK